MLKLNPAQMQAKEVMEWLLDDSNLNRAVGKSFLMSVIFIEKAIENPSVWINVWDHGPYHPKKEDFMIRGIIRIVEDYFPEWEIKISHTRKAFCMKRK